MLDESLDFELDEPGSDLELDGAPSSHRAAAPTLSVEGVRCVSQVRLSAVSPPPQDPFVPSRRASLSRLSHVTVPDAAPDAPPVEEEQPSSRRAVLAIAAAVLVVFVVAAVVVLDAIRP